jgi:hypothetical protein
MAEPKRPSQVTEAQHAHLKAEPVCQITGGTKGLQAHHIIDFDMCEVIGRPELAWDPRNFITLQESEKGLKLVNMHLLAGHGGNFRLINFYIRRDLEQYKPWATMTDAQIKKTNLFKQIKINSPPPVSKWTPEIKTRMRLFADQLIPPVAA